MRRLALKLVSLLAVGMMIVTILALVHDQTAYVYGRNQTEDAIMLALNSDSVQYAMKEKPDYEVIDVSRATNVTRLSGEKPALLNVSGDIYNVHVRLGGNLWMQENHIVMVNVTGKYVMGNRQYFVPGPSSCWIDLPSGAYYCTGLSGVSYMDGGEETWIAVETIPANATFYPMILNSDNMTKFLNGREYVPLVYRDNTLNKTLIYDGNIPVNSNWSTNAYLGPNKPPYIDDRPNLQGIMIVIKNGDTGVVRFRVFNG